MMFDKNITPLRVGSARAANENLSSLDSMFTALGAMPTNGLSEASASLRALLLKDKPNITRGFSYIEAFLNECYFSKMEEQKSFVTIHGTTLHSTWKPPGSKT